MTSFPAIAPDSVALIGWALIHFVWEGAAIAAILWITVTMMRSADATSRYGAGLCALAAMAATPFITLAVLHAGRDAGSFRTLASAETAVRTVQVASPESRTSQADPPVALDPLRPAITSDEREDRPFTEPARRVEGDASGPLSGLGQRGATSKAQTPVRSAGAAESTPAWVARVLPWVVGIWGAGVMVLSARLMGSWVYVHRVWRRRAHPISGDWERRVAQLSKRIGLARLPVVLESVRVDVPAVIGWLRPVVLLPVAAMSGLSAAHAESLLAHELAHIRRHDYLVNLLQCVIETLLFYHPAVWWVSQIIREERENCCDDMAADVCGSRATLAAALMELESLRGDGVPRTALAASGVGALLPRVSRMLGRPVPRDRMASPWWAAVIALTAGAVSVLALAREPQPPAVKPADSGSPASKPVATHPATTRSASSHPSKNVVPVSLKVVDEQGRPIGDAKVWMTGDHANFPVVPADGAGPCATANTDPSGLAQANAPAGKSVVIVTAPGRAPLFVRGVDLTAASPYVLRLIPGHSIAGRVIGLDGMPLAGASIRVTRADPAIEHFAELGFRTTTNANGAFTAEHLGDGSYRIEGTVSGAEDGSFIETVVLDVGPGATTTPAATLELHARRGAVIRGRFVSPDGLALANREVFLAVRLPSQSSRSIRSADDGTFVISGVPTGSTGDIAIFGEADVSARLKLPEGKPFLTAERNQLKFRDVPAGVCDGVEVIVRKDVPLTGVITDAAGKPAPNVSIVVESSQRIFKSDKQGRYNGVVAPGESTTIRALNDGTIEAFETEPFFVEPGKPVERNLKVVLKPKLVHAHQLSGRVVDVSGKPVPKAKVYVANAWVTPDDADRPGRNAAKPTWKGQPFWAPNTQADDQGRFTFNLIDAGTTDVWAAAPDHVIGYVRGVATSVERGEGTTLVVRPQPETFLVGGHVVDADGKPVAGAAMVLFTGDHNSPERLASAESDAAGHFSLSVKYVASREMESLKLLCVPTSGAAAWRTLPPAQQDDVHIKLQPEASIAGRVVDHAGNPLAGARVGLYLIDHPSFGRTFTAHESMRDLPRGATSGADGRYTVPGIPEGATVSLQAKHPEHAGEQIWYVKDVRGTREAPQDIKLPAGVVFAGTVRYEDGKPAGGAVVTLGWFSPLTATADAAGRYRFGGVESGRFRDEYTSVRATDPAEPPQWEGTLKHGARLRDGDRVGDADITLTPSFASRHAAWRAAKGTPRDAGHKVVVLDDADPAFDGKSTFGDSLTVYDAAGNPLAHFAGLNVSQSIGDAHPVIGHPDGSIWLAEFVGNRLMQFGPGLSLAHELPGVKPHSLAVDPKTGNVWTLQSEGTIYGKSLTVFSPSGEVVRRDAKRAGADIAYSAHDDCFWIVGQRLTKVSREGAVVAESPVTFAWVATSVAVDDTDGTVWVVEGEHPQVRGSTGRLLSFDPAGRLLRAVPTDARRVAVARDAVWAASAKGLVKFNKRGDALATLAVRAGSIAIEPDTGYVWVAGQDGIWRLDPDGRPVWEHLTPGGSQKWLALLEPPRR